MQQAHERPKNVIGYRENNVIVTYVLILTAASQRHDNAFQASECYSGQFSSLTGASVIKLHRSALWSQKMNIPTHLVISITIIAIGMEPKYFSARTDLNMKIRL